MATSAFGVTWCSAPKFGGKKAPFGAFFMPTCVHVHASEHEKGVIPHAPFLKISPAPALEGEARSLFLLLGLSLGRCHLRHLIFMLGLALGLHLSHRSMSLLLRAGADED